MNLELHKINKKGRLEKMRYVSHEVDGYIVNFSVDTNRQMHELSSKNKKTSMRARAYKNVLCKYSIDTCELDYQMLDEWVADNCCGLWFREGFNTYNFHKEEDAILFKLSWGIE